MNTEAARIAIKIRLTEISIEPDSRAGRQFMPHLMRGGVMAFHTKGGNGSVTILHRPPNKTKNKK